MNQHEVIDVVVPMFDGNSYRVIGIIETVSIKVNQAPPKRKKVAPGDVGVLSLLESQ